MTICHVLGGQQGGRAAVFQALGVIHAIPLRQVALSVFAMTGAASVLRCAAVGHYQAVDRAVISAEVAGKDAALPLPVLANLGQRADNLNGLFCVVADAGAANALHGALKACECFRACAWCKVKMRGLNGGDVHKCSLVKTRKPARLVPGGLY